MIADKAMGQPQFEFRNYMDKSVGNNFDPEPYLQPQDSVVKSCPVRLRMPGTHIIPGSYVDFSVTYHPFLSIMPERTKSARFVSRDDAHGGIVWLPETAR